MNRIRFIFIPSAATLALVTSPLIFGCQNNAYQERRAMRDEHMRFVVDSYESLEAQRPGHIERVFEWERSLSDMRADNFRTTLGFIEDLEENRRRRWHDEAPQREEYFRRFWLGRPEDIPDTFAKIFY